MQLSLQLQPTSEYSSTSHNYGNMGWAAKETLLPAMSVQPFLCECLTRRREY